MLITTISQLRFTTDATIPTATAAAAAVLLLLYLLLLLLLLLLLYYSRFSGLTDQLLFLA